MSSVAAIGPLPDLRKLKLGVHIDPVAYPQLRKLESLEIDDLSGGLELAVALGEPVTKLSIFSSLERLSEKDISRLTACPNLSSLNAPIHMHAEVAIPLIARALESLVLRCSPDVAQYEFGELQLGSVLQIAQSAPRLANLFLFEAKIPVSELVAVLQHMGPNLKEFGSNVGGQEEPPVRRLNALLETAAENNTSLRQFRCLSEYGSLVEYGNYPANFFTEGEVEVLRNVLRTLESRAPHLDERAVKKYIDRMAPPSSETSSYDD